MRKALEANVPVAIFFLTVDCTTLGPIKVLVPIVGKCLFSDS